jgi:hypothetical protein
MVQFLGAGSDVTLVLAQMAKKSGPTVEISRFHSLTRKKANEKRMLV